MLTIFLGVLTSHDVTKWGTVVSLASKNLYVVGLFTQQFYFLFFMFVAL